MSRPPSSEFDAPPRVESRPRINSVWLGHVLQVLEPMTRPEYWRSSDDEERQFAANEVERLMLALVTHVEEESVVTVPIGTIVAYAEYGAPDGWLPCDGREYPIADYPDLAALIGTRYGTASAGNFRVPNLRGRVAVGVDEKDPSSWAYVIGASGGAATHKLTLQEIPPHQHGIGVADTGSRGSRVASTTATTGWNTLATAAAGGGQPHNNLQPYLVLNYIIRAR